MAKRKRERRERSVQAAHTKPNPRMAAERQTFAEQWIVESNEAALKGWEDEFPHGARTDFQKHFEKSMDELQSILLEEDPLLLLANLGYDSLFASNLEAVRPQFAKHRKLEQHHVELIQRLLLQRELSAYKPSMVGNTDKVVNLAVSATRAYVVQRLRVAEEKYGALGEIVGSTQLHTLAIRNSAYPHQFISLVDQLYAPLENKLLAHRGFTAAALVRMLFAIVKLIEERVTEFRNEVWMPIAGARSFVDVERIMESNEKIAHAASVLKPVQGDSRTFEQFQESYDEWWRTQLPQLMTLGLADCRTCYAEPITDEQLLEILHDWSIPFGTALPSNVEHIMMANDVWDKPFIRLENQQFYCPIGNLLIGFSARLIWNAAAKDPAISAALEDRKGAFLEEAIEKLFGKGFPDAQLLSGVEWADDFDNGENDVVVIIPPYMLIAEAKAHRMDIKAKRGAPGSLKESIVKLVEKPADQSEGFIAWIKRNPGVHQVKTKHGMQTIDCSSVSKFIQLGVTLEHLCPQSSNWQSLADSGIVDKKFRPVPTVRITDLECVCEILSGQIEKLHYWNRRQEIEAAHIPNDELGWLKLYLENRIMFKPSQDFLNTPMLPMFSQLLDAYFLREDTKVNVPKPRPNVPAVVHHSLKLLEEQKCEDWIGTGFIILDLWNEQQEILQQLIEAIRLGKASKTLGLSQYDCVELGSPDGEADLAICAVLYSSATSCKQIAAQVFADSSVDRIIVLGCAAIADTQPLLFVENFCRELGDE